MHRIRYCPIAETRHQRLRRFINVQGVVEIELSVWVGI